MRGSVLAGFVLLASVANGQFVENRGQLDPAARFVAQQGRMSVFVTDASFVVQLRDRLVEGDGPRGANVFFEIEDAARGSSARGMEQLEGRASYLIGNDPRRWTVDVPTWSRVRVTDVRPGVALELHEQTGMIEYDVLLSGGASPADVVFRVRGADSLAIDETGAMVLATPVGAIRQEQPSAVRVHDDGRREPIACRFRLIDESRFTFDLPLEAHGSEIVIDPVLTYVGYLSGTMFDDAYGVTTDASGAVYVVGKSGSTNFPKTPGVFDATLSGGTDGFVSKINAAGTALVYSTYIGGTGSDLVSSIVVDASGQAIVAGWTGASFPTTAGTYDTSYNGWKDAFVAKLNATGTGLVWATVIGGGNDDVANALAVDGAGNVYLAGETKSTNFPGTAGAYDTTGNGFWDGFLVKFNPTVTTLTFATHFGGTGLDWAHGLALASDGTIVVVGSTDSPNFPTTTGAYDTTPNGSLDAYVVKFNSAGSALVSSTVLGSPGLDHGMDLVLDASNAAYITGVALPGFPTTAGAYDQTNYNGDAFVAKLSSDLSSLVLCTFIGGQSTEQGSALAIDAAGCVYVAGFTNSGDFPVTAGATMPTFGGGGAPADGFFAKLSPDLSQLNYSTYFGGTGYEEVRGLTLGPAGVAFVVGSTVSTNLPVAPGPFSSHLGIEEAFFARFELPVASNTDLGPGWSQSSPLTTLSLSEPAVIGHLTSVVIAGAPASSAASLWVSAPATPTTFGVMPIYLNSAAAVPLVSFTTSATGAASFLLPIPPDAGLAGLTVHAQVVVMTSSSPYGLEVSNGVKVVVGY